MSDDADRSAIEQAFAAIEHPGRQADARALAELIEATTGARPVVWPGRIIGFGTHHYEYESGRTGDTAAVGFAPRAQALAVYGVREATERAGGLAVLGAVTAGKGCIYIKDVDAIDRAAFGAVVADAFRERAGG